MLTLAQLTTQLHDAIASRQPFQQLQFSKDPVYGDGSQTRSFCYVDDLVEGIVRLLYSDEHRPVNIGNPHETTILGIAEVINRLVGNTAGVMFKPGYRGEGDPQRRQPDISRAMETLNWQPKFGVEEGIRQTIPYFKRKMGIA